MKSTATLAALLLVGAFAAGGIVLAWWGWQTLDGSLLLLGSRLC
nr:hypothetical protein [Halomonas sp.]